MTKRTSKTLSVPRWKKRRGDLAYEIVDPITGGLWVVASSREMTDVELNAYVAGQIAFCNVERPGRGQTWMLEALLG